jgi:predicted DsbA family dithiol-disulfide isomerase
MKRHISILLLLVFVIPSVALASWWNPTTWKIFSFLHKKNQVENVQGVMNKDEEIAALEKRLSELKGQPGAMGNATNAIEDKAAMIALIKSQVTSELKQKAKEEAEINREKTLSEKVGVSRESLASCVKSTDNTSLKNKISVSVDAAMKGLPPENRGTPYAVVIGPNGVKTEIRGAYPYEDVKKAIDEVLSGNVTNKYTGEVPDVTASDHIKGSINAKVKIIEYSDLECPYCKIFHETMKRAVNEGGGQVAWIYRHWPIHQNSFEKLVASECVAKIKGNNAFWSYVDLIFGMMNQQASVSDKL